MPEPAEQPKPRKPQSWRKLFALSSTAVFVVGPNRRLRYANAAWETATGSRWLNLRGMRLSRYRSGSDLGRTLMPPPEVWRGQTMQTRRAAPGEAHGPPWWDFTFVPLASSTVGKPLAIVGYLTIVGERTPKKSGGKIDPVLIEQQTKLANFYSLERITGTTTTSERYVEEVRLAIAIKNHVKLLGEPGVGKLTTARIIHHQSSQAKRPFVSIDCSGVQPYLNEAQLFGKGGVFTSIGTLYLADPGALPRELQEKILHALQGHRAPRLIWGTTWERDSRLLNAFEERCSVPTLRIPPLRDRLADLPWFVERLPLQGCTLSDEVLSVLAAHSWPGNLRELSIVLRSASLMAGAGNKIQPLNLPRVLREQLLIQQHPLPRIDMPIALNAVLASVERRLIEVALQRHAGSITAAAKQLGLSRAALGRRIESLGLKVTAGES